MFVDSVVNFGVVTVRATAPTTPASGDLWLKTPENLLSVWNGLSWVSVTAKGSVHYMGSVDPTVAATGAAATPTTGDLYFSMATGPAEAGWIGIAGQTIMSGDMLIWDGSKWDALAADIDLSKYLPLIGGAMDASDTAQIQFQPVTTDGTVVVIDAGNGALDNVWIDGGSY